MKQENGSCHLVYYEIYEWKSKKGVYYNGNIALVILYFDSVYNVI